MQTVKRDENGFYWTDETNHYIDKFIQDKELKDYKLQQIYQEHLYPVLDKMIRIIIHRHNFYETGYSTKDLVNQVHSKVFTVMQKSREHDDKYYDPSRSSSFHYFSRIIKNYLVNLQKDHQQREKDILSDTDGLDQLDNDVDDFDANYLFEKYIQYLEEYYMDIFVDGEDRTIIEAFIKVLKHKDEQITALKGLSKIVHDHCNGGIDEEEFYPRYYKVKTIANKIYWRLKKRYINTGRIEIKEINYA